MRKVRLTRCANRPSKQRVAASNPAERASQTGQKAEEESPSDVHGRVRGVSDARADIIGLSDYVYQRTRNRLAGLTDDEYFWEPVPGCWTIRRADSGDYRADHADQPGTPPVTTIACIP